MRRDWEVPNSAWKPGSRPERQSSILLLAGFALDGLRMVWWKLCTPNGEETEGVLVWQ